ncbi:MAG: leucine-rich repeat protein [Bacteroidales bacterium]|nr:leucine-rich repeat protein [Bacteroidales bacterium]
MKKPLLSLALILATSLAGFAQTSGFSGDLTWAIADDTLRIRVTHATNTAGMNNFSNVNEVTTAPWGTVENRDLFYAVIIEERVTSIGDHAFRGLTGLTSATIGTSVTTIGRAAFNNTRFTSIIIPDNVTSIGNVAFLDNPALTSVTIGTGVTTIGEEVFANSTNLSSITVHRTVPPTVESNAFLGLPATACLRVPEASVSAYKDADVWQDFSCIEPISIAVTNITNVPTTVTAGTTLALIGTVNPINATNQTIVWSVQNAGTTGATINGNTLNATSAGTMSVRATIVNGATATTNFTQDFNITVTAESTSIIDIDQQDVLSVHPNPFTDQIHITNAEIGAMLYILNATGNTVHTQPITSQTQTIWLGHLPNGVYILRIGEQSIRIVKQ